MKEEATVQSSFADAVAIIAAAIERIKKRNEAARLLDIPVGALSSYGARRPDTAT